MSDNHDAACDEPIDGTGLIARHAATINDAVRRAVANGLTAQDGPFAAVVLDADLAKFGATVARLHEALAEGLSLGSPPLPIVTCRLIVEEMFARNASGAVVVLPRSMIRGIFARFDVPTLIDTLEGYTPNVLGLFIANAAGVFVVPCTSDSVLAHVN